MCQGGIDTSTLNNYTRGMNNGDAKRVHVYLSPELNTEIEDYLVKAYGPYKAGRMKSGWIREAIEEKLKRDKKNKG